MSVTYTHKNGFSAILYGKSSMSILKNGKEVLHTGSRTVNTEKEVMELLEKQPEFMKAMNDSIESFWNLKSEGGARLNYRNFRKAKAIEKKRERLLKVNPALDDKSGIYFLTRTDEDGINYFYIGQAVHIMQRMCSHLTGYQHIDCSIKKGDFGAKIIPMAGN